jgi:quinol-cytochrome oxidoreductase complex cytochrome b subunit
VGDSGLRDLKENVLRLPRTLKESLIGQWPPASDRGRSQAVFSNLFLHLHPTRVHVRSLRFSTTFGLGIVSAVLFAILTLTGIILMVYYKPSTALAYDSVVDLHYMVPMGRLVRNVHRWAAHLMVASVLLHMVRVFYAGSFKAHRAMNWLVGIALLALTFGLSFTGYLLPWDQLGFWATTIGANIAASPRELTDAVGITHVFDPGGFMRGLLLGAGSVGQEALIRFYLLHVIVLPLALVALVGVHFWRIRKDGGLGKPGVEPTTAGKGAAVAGTPPNEPAEAPRKSYGLMAVVRDRSPATDVDPAETAPSWPYLLRYELLLTMATVLVCVVLGLLFDAPLKSPANPLVPENPAKAPWYFLGLQEMVAYSAFMGGIGVPTLVALALGLAPFLDRERTEAGVYFGGAPGRRVALQTTVFALAASAATVAIPVSFGWLRTWLPDIPQIVITFLNPGSLLAGGCALWSLLTVYRTRSTRMGAIALFTCFVVGFVVLTYVGTYLRGPDWAFYWTRSSWPVH